MLNQLLAGGILTIATAGVATPVLIAGRSHLHLAGGFRKVYNIGFFHNSFKIPLIQPLSFIFHQDLPPGIATSSVGAATNIGTSIVEKLLNSKQIKDLNAAFERDKMLTTKFERQIEEVKRPHHRNPQ